MSDLFSCRRTCSTENWQSATILTLKRQTYHREARHPYGRESANSLYNSSKHEQKIVNKTPLAFHPKKCGRWKKVFINFSHLFRKKHPLTHRVAHSSQHSVRQRERERVYERIWWRKNEWILNLTTCLHVSGLAHRLVVLQCVWIERCKWRSCSEICLLRGTQQIWLDQSFQGTVWNNLLNNSNSKYVLSFIGCTALHVLYMF